MNYRSEPLENGERVKGDALLDGLLKSAKPSTARNRPGMIRGASVERWMISLIHFIAWSLIVLSVLGTFYGARGVDAPILQPLRIIGDIVLMPMMFLFTLALQAILSVVQWGARQMARHHLAWWLLYFAALALSAWWNWQAYGDSMIAAQMPWLLAIGVIIVGDMVPEFALVID